MSGFMNGSPPVKATVRGRWSSCSALVEIGRHLGRRQIGQAVVRGRGFDVAIRAGDVAQRAGVEPQRLKPGQRHARAALALGGDVGVPEFRRVERLEGLGGGDVLVHGSRSIRRCFTGGMPDAIKSPVRDSGCSSMVEQKLPKLTTRVRFPSPAPNGARPKVSDPAPPCIVLERRCRGRCPTAVTSTATSA